MKRNAGVIAALVVAAALAFWGYSAYQKHATRNQVISLVKDTSARLRAALQAELAPPSASAAPIDFEENAAAAEAHVATLRKLETSSMTELADAADHYLVSGREILRKLSDINRGRVRLSASLQSLAQHIQTDRGNAGWTQEAVRIKETVDKDFREYRIAVESYESLLESFPASQTRIAPQVEPTVLIDEKTVRDARQRALDVFASTAQNVKEVASVDAYRVKRPRARRR